MHKEILIIDDNPDIRLLVSNILKEQNFTVRTAANYDQAVYDLTNFLTYIAEPMAEQRKHIGRWVLLFLLLLLVPSTLLAREYSKVMH